MGEVQGKDGGQVNIEQLGLQGIQDDTLAMWEMQGKDGGQVNIEQLGLQGIQNDTLAMCGYDWANKRQRFFLRSEGQF